MTEPKKASEGGKLFDDWPERYDAWFKTPIGRLIRKYESELILDFLEPRRGEHIFDAGCGTGIFTLDILSCGARVTGLDISLPMLKKSAPLAAAYPFGRIAADMMHLPFGDGEFDKVVSVTALEFLEDAESALKELFRVTKGGGTVVVATLNSLSPWAARRRAQAESGEKEIFKTAVFRSPDDLRGLMPLKCDVRTAIHFHKDEDPQAAERIESEGRLKRSDTGAFVVARWVNE